MDIHHRDIKIAEEHLPTNPAEAEYFKRILLTIDYDDFYDIMNVIIWIRFKGKCSCFKNFLTIIPISLYFLQFSTLVFHNQI